MVGETISHYRVDSKLGAGGMGEVYKAYDTKLQRYVALKFLAQHLLVEDSHKARLVREAQAAAGLQHPNICPIFAIEEENRRLFIVMAYLEGETLHKKIQAGPLEIEHAIRYATQAGDGLRAAHASGIVHRDIKPENIMISPEGHVSLLDFGLAQLASASRLTKSGTTLGTVAYMSPEQTMGRPVDARTDIWSLGVVLYETITGALPFQADYALATAYSIVNENPAPLDRLRPEAPGELDAIVRRAMEKDPAARYASAEEMCGDLRRLLQDSSASGVATGRRSVPQAGAAPARKTRALAVAGITAAALTLLVLLAIFTPMGRWVKGLLEGRLVPAEKRLVVLPFHALDRNPETEALASGLSEMLTNSLTQIGQFHGALSVIPASEVRADEVESVRRARELFEVNLAITGSVERRGENLVLLANLVDTRSLTQIRADSIELRTSEDGPLHENVVSRLVSMLDLELSPEAKKAVSTGATEIGNAYSYYLRGQGYLNRYDQAGNLDLAIDMYQKALEKDPNYALARSGLALAYWRKRIDTNDESWAPKAIDSAEQAVALDGFLAQARITLGVIYAGTGRLEDGIAQFDKALSLNPLDADAHLEKARAYSKAGKSAEAEKSFLKAVELRPRAWEPHMELGVHYFRGGRYEEAAKEFQTVIGITPDNHRAFYNLAGVFYLQGKFDQAAAALQKSIEIRPTAMAYSNLGTIFFFQHRYEEAVAAMEKMIGMGNAKYVDWGNLADAYRWSPTHRAKAAEAYRRAIELAEADLRSHPDDFGVKSRLALYRAKLGETREALAIVAKLPAEANRDIRTLYRVAVIRELAGNRGGALEALAKAVANGYSVDEVRNDPELESLRSDARFEGIPGVDQRAN